MDDLKQIINEAENVAGYNIEKSFTKAQGIDLYDTISLDINYLANLLR